MHMRMHIKYKLIIIASAQFKHKQKRLKKKRRTVYMKTIQIAMMTDKNTE